MDLTASVDLTASTPLPGKKKKKKSERSGGEKLAALRQKISMMSDKIQLLEKENADLKLNKALTAMVEQSMGENASQKPSTGPKSPEPTTIPTVEPEFADTETTATLLLPWLNAFSVNEHAQTYAGMLWCLYNKYRMDEKAGIAIPLSVREAAFEAIRLSDKQRSRPILLPDSDASTFPWATSLHELHVRSEPVLWKIENPKFVPLVLTPPVDIKYLRDRGFSASSEDSFPIIEEPCDIS